MPIPTDEFSITISVNKRGKPKVSMIMIPKMFELIYAGITDKEGPAFEMMQDHLEKFVAEHAAKHQTIQDILDTFKAKQVVPDLPQMPDSPVSTLLPPTPMTTPKPPVAEDGGGAAAPTGYKVIVKPKPGT